MRKYAVAVALFVATLSAWTVAVACTCVRPALTDLYKNSTRVFLGEVVDIALLTKDPVDGQEVTYVATVRPLETFKGTSNDDVRVIFTGRYAVPVSRPLPDQPELDPAFAEETVTLVSSSCAFGMSDGKYYVFERQGEPLTYTGWCTQRVVYESLIKLDYMRTLRDAR